MKNRFLWTVAKQANNNGKRMQKIPAKDKMHQACRKRTGIGLSFAANAECA
jgi:hypothetical protein